MPVSVPHGSLARPGASPVDAGAVWAVVTGMYEADAAGDREAIDARLGLDAYDPVIDVFGDLALVRYWLRVDFAPAPDGGRLRLAKTQIPAGTLARATTCQPSPPRRAG